MTARTSETVSRAHATLVAAQLRGGWQVATLSVRRMVLSRQTCVNVLLLVFAGLAAGAWSLHPRRTAVEFVNDIFLPVYVSFLLPVFSLCYSSAGVAGERQESTLVYLLTTPLFRPVVYVAKFVAAAVLVVAWNLTAIAVLGVVAGEPGWQACVRFWPAVVGASLTYTCLFHVFSVVFRRATIVSLGYALVLEAFLGNMPGIVKRLSVSFYTHCLVFDSGRELGLGPAGGRNAALFLPVSGDAAGTVLVVAASTLFVLGLWVFSRREYA